MKYSTLDKYGNL